MMHTITDESLSSQQRIGMYRDWAGFGDGSEPQARVENWPVEDLEMFCGIYRENK